MSADCPETWEELAKAAIADLRNYADDELPHRRMVSVRSYEAIMKALDEGRDPVAAHDFEMNGQDRQ